MPDMGTGKKKIADKTGRSIFSSLYAFFKPNIEISEIRYWDLQSDIGYVDEIDRYLVEAILKST